jgi:membrane fusion protein, multidrug efflux system
MTMKQFFMSRKRSVLSGIALLVLLLIAWRGLLYKPAGAATHDAQPAIAVDTASVAHADVPIYMQGLGTVQAFYTVTVTARVDGELQKVGFTEGQTVHKGDLLAQIDPRPNQAAFDQALATKAKDAAQLANALRDLERYTILQPQDLASKQTVDTQRATVDQLTAQLQVDQAVIDNARTQLDYTRITSPINGRTGHSIGRPGKHRACLRHHRHRRRDAGSADLGDLHAARGRTGRGRSGAAAGPVKVVTVARDGGAELDEGILALIDNQIDQATGTVKLKATFENAHNTLWPGQYVNARVLIRTDRDALTIPDAAVQLGPDGPFTYVVKNDSTVEVRPLHIGEASGGATIVTGGLALDEHVVTSNQYRLQSGVHVRNLAEVATNGRAGSGAGEASSKAP